MWELQGQLSCSFCPQFFCGAAQQLVVEGFPHCCARQINVAGPWEWRCGRHTLQKRKAPSKLCLFVTICPFPIRWVKCLHCEEEEREDAGGQNGYIFVWLVLASPCFMPPSQTWEGTPQVGQMQSWPQGAAVCRKGIAGGAWARQQWCFKHGRGLGRDPAGSAGGHGGRSCVLDRWGTGRRKEACGLPTQWGAAGEFGGGGCGQRTVGSKRSMWGESLLLLRGRTRHNLQDPGSYSGNIRHHHGPVRSSLASQTLLTHVVSFEFKFILWPR